MVLADPRFGIAELVEPLHQLEIAFDTEQRVLVVGMERRQKHPSAKCPKLGHAAPPSLEFGQDISGCRAAGRIFPSVLMIRCGIGVRGARKAPSSEAQPIETELQVLRAQRLAKRRRSELITAAC